MLESCIPKRTLRPTKRHIQTERTPNKNASERQEHSEYNPSVEQEMCSWDSGGVVECTTTSIPYRTVQLDGAHASWHNRITNEGGTQNENVII